MAKFFKDFFHFRADLSVEYLFLIKSGYKSEDVLRAFELEKRKIWKLLREEHKEFFNFPIELNQIYMKNLVAMRNYIHGIGTKEPTPEFSEKTYIINNEAKLLKFIKNLSYEDSISETYWSVVFTINDTDFEYFNIWEQL